MNKIKISSIILMTCLLVTFIFDALVPVWLGVLMGALSIIMLVLLNVEMFKIKGAIKKIVLYADTIVGLFLILTFIPTGFISYTVNNFLSHSLVFVFAGLLIAIIVNAFKIDKKD